MTGALRSLFAFAGWLPLLNLPFVLTGYLCVGLQPQLGLQAADVLRDPLATWLAPGVALPLQSLGALVWVPTASAGCLLLAALLVHSRIATLLALVSALSVHALAALAHAPLPQLIGRGSPGQRAARGHGNRRRVVRAFARVVRARPRRCAAGRLFCAGPVGSAGTARLAESRSFPSI